MFHGYNLRAKCQINCNELYINLYGKLLKTTYCNIRNREVTQISS